MKYLAVIILTLIGLIEFVLRSIVGAALVVFLTVSIIGIVLVDLTSIIQFFWYQPYAIQLANKCLQS